MSGFFGERRTHDRHKSVEWYTPKWIFEKLDLEFDIDPSSPFDFETNVPAVKKLTVFDDGLKSEWEGRVWLNPPYGKDTAAWMERMINHNNGIALVFSRTDSAWFQSALNTADAVLFISGRIQFVPGHENAHKKARSGAGSAMFAWSNDCSKALKRLASHGYFIEVTK